MDQAENHDLFMSFGLTPDPPAFSNLFPLFARLPTVAVLSLFDSRIVVRLRDRLSQLSTFTGHLSKCVYSNSAFL